MPDNYFANYLPLLMHFIVAGLLAGAIVVLSWIIGQRKPNRAKLSPYECGMTPVGDARQRFSVKFYLVAMLFILFDVEAVFLYPWAVILKDLKKAGQGLFGVAEMLVYIAIVLVGFFYIWKKGALDWGQSSTAKRGEF
jgi:NADH-quinone oxidoreductase subunit A